MVRAGAQPLPGRNRGRPARLYSLPEQAPEPGLAPLVAALLAETYDSLPEPGQEAFLRRLAARLAGPSPQPGGLSQRLVFAVQRLNQLGYRARWEARSTGPRLILDSRPFAALQPPHPAIDRLEIYLLECLIGEAARRLASDGDARTGFSIYQVKK